MKIEKYVYFGKYPQKEIVNEFVINDLNLRGKDRFKKNGTEFIKIEDRWFYVEPIKWKVLEENNGEALLVANDILDISLFREEDNNYKTSFIRNWLNKEFYNKAFNKEEKRKIIKFEVDNSAKSTNPYGHPKHFGKGKNKHICENTFDKVSLLSLEEATNPNFGFKYPIMDFWADGSSYRPFKKDPTDYAIFRASKIDKEYLILSWWTRSPESNGNYLVYCMTDGGISSYDECVCNRETNGVVPIIKIKL